MKRLNLILSLLIAGVASLWLGRFQDSTTILVGFFVLFLMARGVSAREVLMTFLGMLVAFFILPVSLLGAMAAFALVQLLPALRYRSFFFQKDRFRESQKTAERILNELS